MSPPAPGAACDGSYTAGHAWPSANEPSLARTSTSSVKLELVILNSRWMSPRPLSAGVPPVATTVAEPPVSDITRRLLTVWLPKPDNEFTDVVPVYVIDEGVER